MNLFTFALFILTFLCAISSYEARKIRWGILSAGRISWDYIKAVRSLDPNEHEVVAIASRNRTRAQKYADTFSIKKVYDRYEELAKDPEVDVVYIGIINALHFSAVKLMLDHKKPVLCEKPFAVRPEEARELFEYAKKQNTFLMEAMWSRFIPAYEKVTELIEKGEIGELEAVQANFLLDLSNVERIHNINYGGGISLDIGVYTWHAVLTGVNFTRPSEIKAFGLKKNEQSADRTVSLAMQFPNGVVGNILLTSYATNGALDKNNNHVLYIGRKGYIRLNVPINAPTEVIINGRVIEMDFRDKVTDFNFSHSSGLRFEAEEVRRQLIKGAITSDKWSPEHTLLIADLNAEVLKQLKVEHPPTDRSFDFKNVH